MKIIKDIQELAVSSTMVAAITPKIIAATIDEIPRHKAVFAQFFRPNRDLVGPGKPNEIAFPKKGRGIVVEWGVAEGESIGASQFAYDATTITVAKSGLRLEFRNEAIKRAMRDVIKDHIYESGLEWTQQLDAVAKTVMLDLQSTTAVFTAADGVTLKASTFVPIIQITSVVGNTIHGVDYYSGTIYFKASFPSSTVTFLYSNRCKGTGKYFDARYLNTLSAWDLFRTRSGMIASTYTPNFVLVNDYEVPGLIYDEKLKFLEAQAYGGTEPRANAEIGKVAGLKVVTSMNVPEGVAIYVDSKSLGYDVRSRPLEGHREDKWEFDSVWYHYWTERNFGVVNDYAVAVSVNHQRSDATYPAIKTGA